jgi:DNA-binding transcriptional ArsR family regulator
MKSMYLLRNLGQVKVLANPLRLKILEALARKAMTTKQVAELLKENPTKLYHHVEALERTGLVRLVRTKTNRGTIEKYYRAMAKEFMVDRGYLELSHNVRKVTSKYEALFLNALRATIQEIKESIDGGLFSPVKLGRNAFIYRCHVAGSKEQIKMLMNRLRKLIDMSGAVQKKDANNQFGLTIAFYPVRLNKRNSKKN